MPRELKNVKITHVSYVDKGANQKGFFLTKSEEQANFQKSVKLLQKADDAQRLVYGVVYEPDAVDAHGDFMKADEIEKAAHTFLKDARNIDLQHNFEKGWGEVVESYIAPAEFKLGTETVKKGSWVLVTKAADEVWEAIKKGDIQSYSMAGVAEMAEKTEKTEKEHDLLKAFLSGAGELLAKAGRKISGSRLEQLKQAQATISGIITEAETDGEVLKCATPVGDPATVDPTKAKKEEAEKLMNEEVKKQLAEIQKQADLEKAEKIILQKCLDDAEAIIKVERDERLKKEYIAKAASFAGLAVKPDEFGLVLKAIFEKSPTEYATLESVLKAADAALTQSKFFNELGGNGTGVNSAFAKVEAMAKEIITKGATITKEQAIAKVLNDNPNLYAEYRKESK